MLKKIFSLSLLCASAHAMIYLPQGITNAITKKYALNKKIILAYDVHDVLAVKDGGAKVKAIIKHLPSIAMSKVTDGAMWKKIDQLKKQGVSGQGYAQTFEKHGYTSLAQMAKETANACKPRKGMPLLVHEMKLLGYTQRFASNIGDEFLKNLNTKFKAKYKIIMLDMIDPGKVVDFSQYGKNPLAKPLPKHLASQPKPDPIFFQEFIDAWNAKLDSLMIFVDDKLENIKAAVSKGFIGIHVNANWDDATFVKQLRTAYQSLGLYDKK